MKQPANSIPAQSPTNEYSIWHEVALLRAENEALRAALREHGYVCLLAGKEMVRRAGEHAGDPGGHPPWPAA